MNLNRPIVERHRLDDDPIQNDSVSLDFLSTLVFDIHRFVDQLFSFLC